LPPKPATRRTRTKPTATAAPARNVVVHGQDEGDVIGEEGVEFVSTVAVELVESRDRVDSVPEVTLDVVLAADAVLVEVVPFDAAVPPVPRLGPTTMKIDDALPL
jgi:hypothetical protein